MLHSLKSIAGFYFYLLAIVILAGLILVRRSIVADPIPAVLHSLDLPLLTAAVIYGGIGLYLSISRGKKSPIVAIVVSVILGMFLAAMFFLNFAYPAVPLIEG